MPNRSRHRLSPLGAEDIVIQAAWMYYQEGLNQNDIAERLSVSRASVVNYLQQARAQGFIRVQLKSELFTSHRYSEALRAVYGLQAAYVLPDVEGEDADVVESRVARGAAQWLPELIAPGDHLGVSWGRTIHELAEALEPMCIADLTVSQLVGSMATPYGFTAEICSAVVARRLSGDCINLHAPAVLSNAELAEQLRREPIIATQLQALAACNKAVFAAGICSHDSHIATSGVANAAEIDHYLAHGAVGVLCGRPIGRNGREIDGPLKKRMIAVELDDLRGLDAGILVSSGEARVEPMQAVLKGGYVTHIVTSHLTARALLEQAGAPLDEAVDSD